MDSQTRLQELKQMYEAGLITLPVYEKQQEVTLSSDPSQHQITHLEQYKMLREEIVQHMRALDTVQNAAAISTAAVYGWLILHRTGQVSPAVWFVVPAVLVFCALKSLDLGLQMQHVAVYLASLEAAAFGDTSALPGWEQYKIRNRFTLYDKMRFVANSLAWLLSVLGSIYLSWRLSR
jgi:hypothetical protein